MEHHVFEDWLFTEDPLSPQEQEALREHLSECESCRTLSTAWHNVEAGLRVAEIIAPAAGFTSRWQARLEADSQRMQRKQSLAILGLSMAGAALLLGSLLIVLWPVLQSPQVLFWTWVYRMMGLYTTLGTIQEFTSVLLQTMFGVIPLIWWVIIAGILSELGVLWVVSLRWLTNPQRGSK
jgi:predicted anti-sigma-YlaC factor YlaD